MAQLSRVCTYVQAGSRDENVTREKKIWNKIVGWGCAIYNKSRRQLYGTWCIADLENIVSDKRVSSICNSTIILCYIGGT